MPDLDPLPGRPRVPDFRPRTGDYATVVGRAKGRRRRHLTAASAGAAGVAVVVALSVGGGGGSFGLKPVEPALPGTTSAPAAPPAASPTAEPQPEPENTATPATTTPDPEGPGASEEPSPAPVPVESPVSAGPDEPHGHPLPVPPPVVVKDFIRNPATELCDSDPSLLSGAGWCLRYQGPAQVASGTVHEYRTLACRPAGRGDGVLRFDTAQEVEFVVRYGEREEWRWSGGYKFPKDRHDVAVDEGYCARWTIEWDATGDDGDPLRPGTYSMSPYVATVFEGNGLWMSTASAYSLEVTE
jgi:hypothetical protein